jgi:hypothetical protein
MRLWRRVRLFEEKAIEIASDGKFVFVVERLMRLWRRVRLAHDVHEIQFSLKATVGKGKVFRCLDT